MRQFTQAEKETLYPVLAKVAEYLIERIAEKERQQAVSTATTSPRRDKNSVDYQRTKHGVAS
jgi:hypothetical protein